MLKGLLCTEDLQELLAPLSLTGYSFTPASTWFTHPLYALLHAHLHALRHTLRYALRHALRHTCQVGDTLQVAQMLTRGYHHASDAGRRAERACELLDVTWLDVTWLRLTPLDVAPLDLAPSHWVPDQRREERPV